MHTPEQLLKDVANTLRKTATDSDFRQLALTNPAAALNQLSGQPLPPNARIRFVEPEDVVIVLPPAQIGTEIDEAQLEGVSGGHVNWTYGDLITHPERYQKKEGSGPNLFERIKSWF